MRNQKRLGWLAAFASMLLLATMSYAQTSTTTSSGKAQANTTPQTSDQIGANNNSPRTGGVPTKDHTFMVKAAQGGLAEVQLGQLAEQNGESQQVKDFGKRMVDDHSKANEQLKQLASQKGVTLPEGPDAKDKAQYDRLSKLKGDAFDKAYAKQMVTDHKKDVAEFQRESKSGSDPDVKNWASQTVPTLQDHLQMAEQMNGGAKSASSQQNPKSMSSSSSQPQ